MVRARGRGPARWWECGDGFMSRVIHDRAEVEWETACP